MDGMNGLDIGLILVIVAVGVVGLVRGFGRTALDALALYAALWGASLAAPAVAARVSFHAGGAGINESWAFTLLFLVLGPLLLGVSWYVYGLTQLDLGMFDKLLGLAAGLAAGVIVAHALTETLVMGDPKCVAAAAPVNTGTVGSEVYGFPGYHALLDTVTGAKTYMKDAPNPSSMAGK